jgi:hypothetical protein
LIFIGIPKKTQFTLPFAQGPGAKYRMRPICQACNQRPCAVNYIKEDTTHYRSRCETCQRRGRGIKPREPRWKSAGYKKKPACDRCGFRARFASQLLVYHIDGDLNNVSVRNLRTVCRNCVEEISKVEVTWRAGDLEPDA